MWPETMCDARMIEAAQRIGLREFGQVSGKSAK
jgi:hypothetical protein